MCYHPENISLCDRSLHCWSGWHHTVSYSSGQLLWHCFSWSNWNMILDSANDSLKTNTTIKGYSYYELVFDLLQTNWETFIFHTFKMAMSYHFSSRFLVMKSSLEKNCKNSNGLIAVLFQIAAWLHRNVSSDKPTMTTIKWWKEVIRDSHIMSFAHHIPTKNHKFSLLKSSSMHLNLLFDMAGCCFKRWR